MGESSVALTVLGQIANKLTKLKTVTMHMHHHHCCSACTLPSLGSTGQWHKI